MYIIQLQREPTLARACQLLPRGLSSALRNSTTTPYRIMSSSQPGLLSTHVPSPVFLVNTCMVHSYIHTYTTNEVRPFSSLFLFWYTWCMVYVNTLVHVHPALPYWFPSLPQFSTCLASLSLSYTPQSPILSPSHMSSCCLIYQIFVR